MYTAKEVQGLLESYAELKESRETHGHGLNTLVKVADLNRAMDFMPRHLWVVLTFYGKFGLTAREYADQLNVPRSTVSDRYHAGIDWIVRFLNEGVIL